MYKRGNRWYSDFWHNGERYTKAWGEISKTVAKEKDRKFRTEVEEGKYLQKSKRILFNTFSEKYLEAARVNKRPSSAKRNEVSIKMMKPYFGDTLIDKIHPFMVEQYKRDRKDQGAKPGTINRDVTTLKNMLNKAVEWGYLPINPISKVMTFKEDNEVMWALSPEEERRLLIECDARPQKKKYLRDLVLFAINTGMRQGEIFNLETTKVNLKDNYIEVTDTKTHENRKVPINETVRAILERRLSEGGDYVFSSAEGNKLTVLTNAFWKAIDEAGLCRWETGEDGKKKMIERVRFHDLRHTFGSRLGMAGVDLKTIMEIMGHKTHKMAMRYQHPSTSHKLNAVRILDQVPSKFTTGQVVNIN